MTKSKKKAAVVLQEDAQLATVPQQDLAAETATVSQPQEATAPTPVEPQGKQVKIGVKSFVIMLAILLAVIIAVGVMTYVIPAGRYQRDENGQIIEGSYVVLEEGSPTRLHWLRWFTAPFEAIFLGNIGDNANPNTFPATINVNEISILALLLILGGTFKVLEESGGLVSLVRLIIQKVYKRRFLTVWIMTLLIMVLSAVFGLQEQLLILYPLFLLLCTAMNWSNFTAICFILITSGVGFTTALTNPLTIGMAVTNAAGNLSVLDGLWYRAIIFVVMYVVTSLFMVYLCRRDEKKATTMPDLSKFILTDPDEQKQDKKKALMVGLLFGIALLSVIVATVIPALRSSSMIIMGGAFIVGTVVVGRLLLGSWRKLGKAFVGGMKDIAPSLIVIVLAFSVPYIAKKGDILDTIFHYFYGLVQNSSPYVAVLILYVFILVLEFFIPSASAKAVLIIPMLTMANLGDLTTNTVILTYLFADGYTNVLFPTCGTLLIGLGLADVGLATWFKKTIVFQLICMAISIGFLMLAIAIRL